MNVLQGATGGGCGHRADPPGAGTPGSHRAVLCYHLTSGGVSAGALHIHDRQNANEITSVCTLGRMLEALWQRWATHRL